MTHIYILEKTMLKIEKISYMNLPNCYRVSNGTVDFVVTTDCGPRVIRFGFTGQQNMFAENCPLTIKSDLGEWSILGGHRLWHSPEGSPRSYYPDKDPVRFEEHNGFVRVIQKPEPHTHIEKEIDIALSPSKAEAKVTHRLRNLSMWDIELAPWALSVMAIGGKAIAPIPPRFADGLLPTNPMVLWSYTDMTDDRWTWGRNYIMLQQKTTGEPQKIGMMVKDNWAAYVNKNQMFLKTFTFDPNATYPDFGCSVEIYTGPHMLELETVAPLTKLAPKAHVEHVENWFLFDNVPTPMNDADIEKNILPKAKAAKG